MPRTTDLAKCIGDPEDFFTFSISLPFLPHKFCPRWAPRSLIPGFCLPSFLFSSPPHLCHFPPEFLALSWVAKVDPHRRRWIHLLKSSEWNAGRQKSFSLANPGRWRQAGRKRVKEAEDNILLQLQTEKGCDGKVENIMSNDNREEAFSSPLSSYFYLLNQTVALSHIP